MSNRLVFSHWGVWVVSSLAALAFLSALPARSQEPIAAPREVVSSAQPADLRCVPADAAWMVSLKVADVWKSKPAALLRHAPGLGDMLTQQAVGLLGLTPSEIRRATVLQYRQDVACVFTLSKPVSKTHLVQRFTPHAKQRQLAGLPYYIREENWLGLVLLDEHTVLIGKANDVEALVCNEKPCGGPLQHGLNVVADGHDLVIAVNPAQLASSRKGHRQGGRATFDTARPSYHSLNQANWVTVAVDFKPQEMTAEVRLSFATERQARQAEQAIHPLRKDLQEMMLGCRIADPEDETNPLGRAVDRFSRACVSGLHALKVEREGTRVQTTLSVQCSGSVLGAAFLTMQSGVLETWASETNSVQKERMSRLGVAMLESQRKTGRLPPRAIYGADGKPLLSWRVALLPYLGEKELYKQFRLDEPWDSDHNRKLIARMPEVFQPFDHADAPTTPFQVFWGKDTVFSGPKGKKLSDLKDGPEQTILIVEATRRVPWTKPEDVHVSADESLQRPLQGNLRVVMADGRVLLLPGFSRNSPLNERHLRALITPSGADKNEAQCALQQSVVCPPQGGQSQTAVTPAVYQPEVLGMPQMMPAPPSMPPPQYVPPPVALPMSGPRMMPSVGGPGYYPAPPSGVGDWNVLPQPPTPAGPAPRNDEPR